MEDEDDVYRNSALPDPSLIEKGVGDRGEISAKVRHLLFMVLTSSKIRPTRSPPRLPRIAKAVQGTDPDCEKSVIRT
ncbi:unnamed protein product [Soboliphyme baturini]|uniref:Uncharacterized protein n=1 Tax=Soboliphyme baturini TaxID=241478 RepID=A0A183IA22_9BILA|nr:unnamed protein product [Soboliphyme baturini]